MFCCGFDMAQAIIGAVPRRSRNIIFAILRESRPYEAAKLKGGY